LENPLVSGSLGRVEEKLTLVGSSSDPAGFATGPCVIDCCLWAGKKPDPGFSTYCWEDWACAVDLLRAGDTPELLPEAMFEAPESRQGVRVKFQPSESDGTRDPDPAFLSMVSEGVVIYVPFSRCLELSRTVDPNPAPTPMGLLFHMLAQPVAEPKD
jgi:hypothetical protein